ncbi:MAG: hypothetical protein ACHQF0_03635 [Chitinophagales bacterium]
MKWIATSILILLVATQTFSKWIMMAEFSIYRNYIAKNLCENRYRPMLHCNGKCILMKKMAAEENQSSPAGTIKLNWETLVFIDTHAEYSGKNFLMVSKRFLPAEFYGHYDSFAPDVFRPPLD